MICVWKNETEFMEYFWRAEIMRWCGKKTKKKMIFIAESSKLPEFMDLYEKILCWHNIKFSTSQTFCQNLYLAMDKCPKSCPGQ